MLRSCFRSLTLDSVSVAFTLVSLSAVPFLVFVHRAESVVIKKFTFTLCSYYRVLLALIITVCTARKISVKVATRKYFERRTLIF